MNRDTLTNFRAQLSRIADSISMTTLGASGPQQSDSEEYIFKFKIPSELEYPYEDIKSQINVSKNGNIGKFELRMPPLSGNRWSKNDVRKFLESVEEEQITTMSSQFDYNTKLNSHVKGKKIFWQIHILNRTGLRVRSVTTFAGWVVNFIKVYKDHLTEKQSQVEGKLNPEIENIDKLNQGIHYIGSAIGDSHVFSVDGEIKNVLADRKRCYICDNEYAEMISTVKITQEVTETMLICSECYTLPFVNSDKSALGTLTEAAKA